MPAIFVHYKMILDLLPSCVLVVIIVASTTEAKSILKCSKAEHAQIQESHLACTKQVEERYTLLAAKFESRITSPVPSALGNRTSEGDPEELQVCNLMHDVVEKCGQIYQKCLEEEQYRCFYS